MGEVINGGFRDSRADAASAMTFGQERRAEGLRKKPKDTTPMNERGVRNLFAKAAKNPGGLVLKGVFYPVSPEGSDPVLKPVPKKPKK